MQWLDLQKLEIELKKRWQYPYLWGRKQNNDWDYRTNFIYKIQRFDDLLNRLNQEHLNTEFKNYALNRWYNFWSAKAVEFMFASNYQVIPHVNQYDKLVDFSINGIPFDHKTSIFPKGFGHSFDYAQQHKDELIRWLYENQSKEGRMHYRNRLFLILYDSKEQQHWKLKAKLTLLKNAVEQYLYNFDPAKLIKIKFLNYNFTLSDVIFVKN